MKKWTEVNPKEKGWWRLFDECSNCSQKTWVQDILCNAEGKFLFKTTCFQCGVTECFELEAKHIASMCYDLDFMALVGIKSS